MTPTRACVCRLGDGRIRQAAIWAAGSPDLDQQVADFDRDHSGPGHERVERLPTQHGDSAWGWSPGSKLPFPGVSGHAGAAQGAAGRSGHAREAKQTYSPGARANVQTGGRL